MAEKTYEAAAHAMQSGVALKIEHGSNESSPKHLRVGVNSAMIENAALVTLLVEKGIITEEEFSTELTKQMNAEADRYEAWAREHIAPNVILG